MKRGFTLSEVLITLGVVGVVAVLTIPGVMKNYQNRLYTAQLEKVYAQLADAVQGIMNDEHVDNFYETTAAATNTCDATTGECSAGIGYFLNNYFKTIKKNCMNATNEACMSTQTGFYKTVNGTSVGVPTDEYFVQTITGAAIGGTYNKSKTCMKILVDVNGPAEPNVAGRDVFAMQIRPNGALTDYGGVCETATKCTTGTTGNPHLAAAGCLDNIIEAGWKMEY